MEPSVANLRARLSSEGLSNQKERPTDEEIDHRSLWVNPRNIVILGPLTSRLPKKLSGLSLTVPWVLQDPAKFFGFGSPSQVSGLIDSRGRWGCSH